MCYYGVCMVCGGQCHRTRVEEDTCHSMHVELKGQVHGVGSLPQLVGSRA